MSLGKSFSQNTDENQIKEVEDLLNSIPHDILHEIFSYFQLDPKEFTHLSQTSRAWHQFISTFCHQSIKKYFPYLLDNPQCHHWGDYQPIGFFFKECQYYALIFKGIPLSAILAALNGDPSKLIKTPGAPKSLAYCLMMLNNHKLPKNIDETTLAIAQKPLLKLSASIGRVDVVKTIITNKAISKTDIERALGEAAGFNHLDIMDILLNLGLGLSLDEAFCKAAAGGHVEALQKLSNLKNFSASTKSSAFLNAVMWSHFQALEFLLMMISVPADTLGEALLIAAQKGNLPISCLLLEKASFISQKIKNQALIKAANCGNAELVSIFKNTFDFNFASTYNMMVNSGFVEQAESFRLSARIDHHASKVSAFILAAANGHVDVVSLFADDLEISETDYIGSLKEAVRHGHIEIVKLLSQKKNKIIGETVLLEACSENQVHIAAWAISYFKHSHANLSNALQRASRFGAPDIVASILNAGSRKLTLNDKFTALMLAVSHGHLDAVKKFEVDQFHLLEILELIKNAKNSPNLMLYLLEKVPAPATQIAIKIKDRTISLLAFVAAFGSTETLGALLENANCDWGNLRQAALDLAIAHNREQNADLIQANMSEQHMIQTVPRALLPAYEQSIVNAPVEEHVELKKQGMRL